jgi:hypothetical protein
MNRQTLAKIKDKIKKAKRKPLGRARTIALQRKFNKRREKENKNNWSMICISPPKDNGIKAFDEIMGAYRPMSKYKPVRVGGKSSKQRTHL